MWGLLRAREWPTPDHAEIVKRARLLVIDDGPFPYLTLFERDGYTMTQWADVEDLGALEGGAFDVILLDLRGVGRQESADEGFGVLRHIRETSPGQIVVAYSNEDLSLAYQPFFRDADAVLHKTTDYVEFKRVVDRLLDERFSLGFYLSRIENELGDYSAKAPKAVAKARSAILRGDTSSLRKYLSKKLDDTVTVDRVIALAALAIQVAGVWKS
jgi:CheY-like chemotaxis protein